MAHVFLSYSRHDRRLAERVIHAFEAYGLTVWWDWKIDGGQNWRITIAERLKACGTVVVLWTNNSVRSTAVIEEASVGAQRGVLIPLLMDKSELPYGFGEINYIPLDGWSGQLHDSEFQRAVDSIKRRLGGFTLSLTPAERSEIVMERRSRAFCQYELKLRDGIVNVILSDEKDDEGVTRARLASHLKAEDNADYLAQVLNIAFGDRHLDELIAEQIQATPHAPVSSLEELAQSTVDRATLSYREQFDVG